jgi:small subunit ribosomal protein S6
VKRDYEIALVLPAGRSDEEYNEVLDRVTGWVTDGDGEVTNTDVWGRRRLAYQIGQNREGYYVFLKAHIDAASVNEVGRRLNIDSDVVRYLVVREDE